MTKINFKTVAVLLGIASVTFAPNAMAESGRIRAIALELPPVSSNEITTVELAQAKQLDDDKNDRRRGGFWQKLNLTNEQQKQMRVVKEKYKPQMSSLREQIQAEREKLATMMQGNQSESSLRSQHQKIVNLDQQIHNLRFESMLEMRSVLTMEQRQQFADMMDDRRANRQRSNRQLNKN